MKILVCKKVGGAWVFITQGMMNALEDSGFEVARYDGNLQSWHDFDPDLYIGCSGHRQSIPENRKAKVAIHVNPYCDQTIKPNINESDDAVKWVVAQNPEIVFGYGFECHKYLWTYWGDVGTKWIPMPTAGDATLFKPNFGDYESRKLAYAYVGGRWQYKSQTIDEFLMPIIRKSRLNGEVWGWGNWPTGVANGEIKDDDVPKLFNNAYIGPCVSEPHTLVWGIDLPERMFKVILSGMIAVHDPVADLDKLFDTILWCHDPDNYFYTIKSINKYSIEKKLEIAKSQYTEISSNHTYHDRMANLLRSVGYNDEAEIMLKSKEKHIEIV